MGFNIAIDGPAGAGKSTVAKTVAERLRFIYVDTGAMYRTIGLCFLENGIDLGDEAACVAALPDIEVSIGYENGAQQVYLNGRNVSGLIRTQEVGEAASRTSGYAAVRKHLLELQHKLARENDVLMDGRDIGTTILPDAELKIYLTASSLVRAERRMLELHEKGEECDLEAVRMEIEERDRRDMEREVSPLRQAEDAIVVDTSYMTIDEVSDVIVSYAEERRYGSQNR